MFLMKKSRYGISVCLLIALCFSRIASGYAFVNNGIAYQILSEEDKTVAVDKYGWDVEEYTGNIFIPGKVTYDGVEYLVTSISDRAFNNCRDLTAIDIPESVVSIGNFAFYNCVGLMSVKIPEGVISIGQRAFSGCMGLTKITIPFSLTELGDGAFSGCPLIEVVINSPVPASGGRNAFSSGNILFIVPLESVELYRAAWGITNIAGIAGEILYPEGLPYEVTGRTCFYDYDGNGSKDLYAITYDDRSLISVDFSGMSSTTHYVFPDVSKKKFSLLHLHNALRPSILCAEERNVKYILDQDVNGEYRKLEKYGSACDINSDGRIDLFNADFYYQQNADGSFISIPIKYRSVIDSTLYDSWKSTSVGGVNLSSGYLLGQMFVTDFVPVDISTIRDAIDFDKNGYVDILDEKGNILFNGGDGTFRSTYMNGTFFVKDLNNDGITDYVQFDGNTVKALVYVGESKFEEQILVQGLEITDAYCFDLDKDGDIDVLLTFSSDDKYGAASYSYIVVCENNGDGHFKIHENYYENKWFFRECYDLDNDGYYEVIAHNDNKEIGIFRCSGHAYIEPEGRINMSEDFSVRDSLFAADINNDGRGDIICSRTTSSSTYIVYPYLDCEPNEAPATLPQPRIVPDIANGKLTICWEKGSDKESSSADLTYALRIGSLPGQGDVYFAHAMADGTRLNFSPGNMGTNLEKVLDVSGWSPGDYYISVQVVDPMFMGSGWSPEIKYTHSGIPAKFSISREEMCVADTLSVALNGNAAPSYHYSWSMDGGRVVSTNDDHSVFKLCFDTEGVKRLSLMVKDMQDNIVYSQDDTIRVYPNHLEYTRFTEQYPTIYMDINEDGKIDFGCSDGFYLHTGSNDPCFKKESSIFNSNLQINGECDPIDFNLDGIPDIIGGNINKGNLLMRDESGRWMAYNKDVILLAADRYQSGSLRYSLDLNNDGYPEMLYPGQTVFHTNVWAKNQGDNLNFETLNKEELGFKVDLNRDGFVDELSEKISKDTFAIRINKGDFKFEDKTITVSDPFISGTGYQEFSLVADLNNDGYQDIVFRKDDKRLVILLGDPDYNYDKYKVVYLPEGYSLIKKVGQTGHVDIPIASDARDFDNNGFPDLRLSVFKEKTGKYVPAILYFYPGLDTRWNMVCSDVSSGYADFHDALYPFLDIDGDGTPDLCESSLYDVFSNLTSVKNISPEIPKNVRATVKDLHVLLQWDDAKDVETPPMQMRYNVSVKKKGATGDNSFIISPMNGLNDKATIIPMYYYRTATCMAIPASRFEIGQEYEIQVQSIDLWNAVSPMSEPFVFCYNPQEMIVLPDENCAGAVTTVHYAGPQKDAPIWNWDGGELVSGQEYGPYEIRWDYPGVKQISVTVNENVYTAVINITEDLDLDFILPDEYPAGQEIAITLPDDFINHKGETAISASDKNAQIIYKDGAREAIVVFAEKGDYDITLSCNIESCGLISESKAIHVTEKLPVPAIELVTIDAATGKNRIDWNLSDLPDYVTSLCIYRESARYGQFTRIAEVSPFVGQYIDYGSDPQVVSNRYRITLNTKYGIEGSPSKIHKSLHLTLNKGIGNAINLIWNAYEGRTIESYRILRGSDPENLSLLAEVSGANTSYSDLLPLDGDSYYVLEYSGNSIDSKSVGINKSVSAVEYGCSNIVNTLNSREIQLADKINVLSVENIDQLTPESKVLHLYAEIFPVTVGIRNVTWSIVKGEDIAEINSLGLLSANNKNGEVVVRATAMDGSGIYSEKRFLISGFKETKPVTNITIYPEILNLYPGQKEYLTAIIFPEDATNKNVRWISTDESVAIVTDGWVTAQNNGTAVIKVVTEDGNFEASCTVVVSDELGLGYNQNNLIKIYPVPVKDILKVEGVDLGDIIVLINASGQSIRRKYVDNETLYIDMKNLPAGIYYLNINGKLSKIMKE